MSQRTSDVTTNSFVPWRDGAFLPEESNYSVLNKAAWFAGMAPRAFLRECRSIDGRSPTQKRGGVNLGANVRLPSHLINERIMPIVGGASLKTYVLANTEAERRDLAPRWRSRWLRVCPQCVLAGTHLRIHQHLAVVLCPVHGVELTTACPHCGGSLTCAAEEGRAPFCCNRCGESLLRRGRITTEYQCEMREQAAAASAEFEHWRRHSMFDANIGCGILCLGMDEDHPLQALTSSRMFLQATLSGHAAPGWTCAKALEGADVSFRTIDLCAPLRKAMDRFRAEKDLQSIEAEWSSERSRKRHEFDVDGTSVLNHHRFRVALRRVTSVFLARFRSKHTGCLDTPYRMFHESLLDKECPEDILGCCPVATGFWLWRISAAASFREIASFGAWRLRRARYANVDRLLFMLAKGHLHYCIYLCRVCAKWAESNVARSAEAVQPILEFFSAPGVRWHPLWADEGSRQLMDFDSRCHFVGFDASRLIHGISCCGVEPYVRRLRWQLRNTPVVARNGRLKFIDREDLWAEHQIEQVDPFAPMKRDYLFFSEENSASLSTNQWRAFEHGVPSSERVRFRDDDSCSVIDTCVSSNQF